MRSLLFYLVLWWRRPVETGACANRVWRRWRGVHREVTIVVRNTSLSDGYSREEITEMLATVRRCERLMGWKAPEVE